MKKASSMTRLQDKVALVSGGNSGIGLAIAKRFAAEGAHVVITGRRVAQLEEAAATIGGATTAVVCDMTIAADQARLFDEIEVRHGRLDVLVVNAGSSEYGALAEATEAHFDRTFDLNVRAALFTAQRAAVLMRDGGSMVLIGSIAGFIGTPGYGVYGASKAAVRSFARTWTNELAGRGIRVNALSPGPIDTPMFDAVSDEMRAQLTGRIPLGRLGRPEEVAAAALFLASDDSSFVAGAELCIDGGMAQV
jgi:NAD(P)-dependent dehydrogenase (short-subunit alcohol dehydrogenase family)